MYKVMVCRIVFPATRNRGEVEVRKVQAISAESTWKNLTASASIKLASRLYFAGKEVTLKELIQREDPVQVYCGYGLDYVLEFDGFVSGVLPTIPVEIKCEDYMYLLKRKRAHFNYNKITLKQLLTNILPSGITFIAPDVDLGSFIAKDSTVAKVLEKIKESYGLNAFFRGKQLNVGFIYSDRNAAAKTVKHTFLMPRDIKGTSALEYREKDDVKVKIVVKSPAKGKDIRVEVGDDGGEVITIDLPNLTEAAATKIANERLAKSKVQGFKGSFKTYGLPYIQHGDIVRIEDVDYPEKNGNYFVDDIKLLFDSSAGYERTITLGSKAN